MTWRQPAGVRSISTSDASQRLHAGDLILKKKIKSSVFINSSFSSLNILRKSSFLAAKRDFSTSTSISPSYVTGFSDGESSFHISILKKKGYKIGYQVLPVFTIQLHINDLGILEKIKNFFGAGVIIKKKNKLNELYFVIYSVQSLKEINSAIIPHFDKYPLLTKKKADFLLFKKVIDLMNKGEHLTKDGLEKIVSIKASMNKGLSEKIKIEFPNITPVQRPEVDISYLVLDPY